MKTSRSRCARRLESLERLEPRIAPALIYGVSNENHLIVFDSAKTTKVIMDEPIDGIGVGENIVGLDFRPATGGLYAVTVDGAGAGRLYLVSTTVNPAAAQIGTPFGVTLTGTHYDIDFNPFVDRIRVVSDAGENFRVNPNTGAFVDGDGNGANGLTPDVNLSYTAGDPNAGQTPLVAGIAYTNSFADAATAELFALDATTDFLAKLTVPNNGQLTSSTKSLGVAGDFIAGFDILAGDSFGYAAIHSGTKTKLYSVDLATGAAKSLGVVSDQLVSISVALGHLSSTAPGTLSYRDVDGDTVTIKTSKGTLLGNTKFTIPNALGGMQLQKLTLTAAEFAAASVSITAKASPALGNGYVNVGRIDADGTDLKALTVRGDLGSITAGDFSSPALSIGNFAVHSIGLFGVTTQEIGGTVTHVLGEGAGSVRIATTVESALLSLGDVKSFSVGGIVNNSTVSFASLGTATFAGSVGHTMINASDVKKITAGEALSTVDINAGTLLGSISARGEVFDSSISAESVGSVKISGSLFQSEIVATNGSIGAITVGLNWHASSAVANVAPGGDLAYGTGDDTTTTASGGALAKIASITVKGQMSGSADIFFYGIEANSIGRVSIGGRAVALTSGLDDIIIGPAGNIRLREFAVP